jgi:porin
VIGWLLAWLAAFAPPPAAAGQDLEPSPPAERAFPVEARPSAGPSLLQQPYLTGDWRGFRTTLEQLGIVPRLTFVTDVLGNPVGGQRQAVRETDNLGIDLAVDLEKLAGWTGSRLHVSFSWRSGTSLSTDDIGNVFNVAQLCCGHTYRLVDVYFEQALLDDAINVAVGRLAAGDDFLTSPLYWSFVQSSINGNPSGISFNVPFTTYPTATWGARVRVTPVPALYVMAGVYNGDPTPGDNGKHGVDWTMRGPLFTIGEVGYRLNQGPGATGLPGNYKLGGFYHDGDYPDLFRDVEGGSAARSGLPPRPRHGNGGFYVLLDQMVYRPDGPGSARGLTPFASLLFSPDQDINTMPFFANGGLVHQGLFPSRPRDTAALGVAYGAFSRQLRRAQRDARGRGAGADPQRYELALELTYVIQATRWLQVQPDVQHIVNPGGTGKIRDALVIGLQLAINL